MSKTNILLKDRIIIIIAFFIASCVFMLSVHAKDVVHYNDIAAASQVGYHDISSKATSELHDHVDKQIVKTFDKNGTSDNGLLSVRSKEDLDMVSDEDPGLWGRFHETLLLLGVYASLTFHIH